MVSEQKVFMKLTRKGSLAGLILAGILVMMPGAAFAQGDGGHASLLASGRTVTHRVQNGSDQDFYQPARDPQFNTARDQ